MTEYKLNCDITQETECEDFDRILKDVQDLKKVFDKKYNNINMFLDKSFLACTIKTIKLIDKKEINDNFFPFKVSCKFSISPNLVDSRYIAFILKTIDFTFHKASPSIPIWFFVQIPSTVGSDCLILNQRRATIARYYKYFRIEKIKAVDEKETYLIIRDETHRGIHLVEATSREEAEKIYEDDNNEISFYPHTNSVKVYSHAEAIFEGYEEYFKTDGFTPRTKDTEVSKESFN